MERANMGRLYRESRSGVGLEKLGFKENEGVGNYVELKECMWDMHKALTVPNWLSLRVCT